MIFEEKIDCKYDLTTGLLKHSYWDYLEKTTLQPNCTFDICVFPKIGVSQNGWFMMENPIKIDHPYNKTLSVVPHVIPLSYLAFPETMTISLSLLGLSRSKQLLRCARKPGTAPNRFLIFHVHPQKKLTAGVTQNDGPKGKGGLLSMQNMTKFLLSYMRFLGCRLPPFITPWDPAPPPNSQLSQASMLECAWLGIMVIPRRGCT